MCDFYFKTNPNFSKLTPRVWLPQFMRIKKFKEMAQEELPEAIVLLFRQSLCPHNKHHA